MHQHLVACEQISELEIGLPHCFSEVVIRLLEPVYQAAELGLAGSKDDCDLLLELERTPSASSRFLDACFIKVAATRCGGEQVE